ncbi:FtsQ-type POTRA domain-containing protein [bacterium]|nr:FtsQ-type POTRA domain-containing protein [bacterium]
MSNEYIIQRRMKQYRLRRKARRGEILLRRIYKFIRFLFLLFVIYGIHRVAFCHYWYLSSNLFEESDTNRLEILGNKIVPDEKIINELQKIQFQNEPIYKINPVGISNEITKLQPIKHAYIRRYWFPARLVVMVEEVTPAITVSPSEDAPDVAAFSLTGELISRDYLPFNHQFETVRILSYGNNGDDYEKWDTEKINYLYKLAKTIEEYSGEKVQYIDLRIPNNAFAQLDSVKLRLGKTDVSLFKRIKQLKDILNSPDVIRLKQHTKYIDLSWQNVKYVNLDE